MFATPPIPSKVIQICVLNFGGPIVLLQDQELMSSCKFVWPVMESSPVDQWWGVLYWFVSRVWSADHFWFEIGSRCFDSSLLWDNYGVYLQWIKGREVVEAG